MEQTLTNFLQLELASELDEIYDVITKLVTLPNK